MARSILYPHRYCVVVRISMKSVLFPVFLKLKPISHFVSSINFFGSDFALINNKIREEMSG